MVLFSFSCFIGADHFLSRFVPDFVLSLHFLHSRFKVSVGHVALDRIAKVGSGVSFADLFSDSNERGFDPVRPQPFCFSGF